MATVTKTIADDIIAGKYDEDNIVKIVKYTNFFNGGDAYGIVQAGQDPDMYRPSAYVINPELYWEKK